MDEGNPAVVQSSGQRHVREQRRERAAPLSASTQHVAPANPSRSNRSGFSPRQTSSKDRAPSGTSVSRSSSARWTSQRSSDSPSRGKGMGKFYPAFQNQGSRGARSAPNSAGKPKPEQENPFKVRMNDFPQLAGPTAHPQTPQTSSPWQSSRRESPIWPQQLATKVDPSPCVASAGECVSTSWANIASQPPKKPVAKESPVRINHVQLEEGASPLEEGNTGKKKRKKRKKKAKSAGENEDADLDEPVIVNQEPPKLEDDEEFPGLFPAVKGNKRISGSITTAKQCNQENQREGDRPQAVDQSKDRAIPATVQPVDASKKVLKAEKASGKKSKFPVQLDIGNMLAALEKKQQTHKDKQDMKPVILSVGGGLPVVQKQPSAQKKPPWQQDKIAHNPLDSTSPLVKKGKQREVPKAKKPTALKKVILKEREERKQRRLLEEMGLLPEQELQLDDQPPSNVADATGSSEEVNSPAVEVEDPSDAATHLLKEEKQQQQEEEVEEKEEEEEEEEDKDGAAEQQSVSPVACPKIQPRIHSRKFRDYCNQMLSKDVDACVTALMKELVRFQDRLYQKDPMKARMKRRIVMGLREVLKHLKLRKIKCVVISPNCECIQSKGGLDEALYTIINTCRQQEVPFVFALNRKTLGRCVNKVVPVSLVGIFNYDGAQDIYHKMIELSSEARKAYEVMMLNLEQSSGAEAEREVTAERSTTEAAETSSAQTPAEQPDYLNIWKKIVTNESKHTFLNFEEQLSFMRLESERMENGEEEKS